MLPACKSKQSASEQTPPPPSASAKARKGLGKDVPVKPASAETIQKEVNPRNEAVYSGPEATIRGTVRVTGDEAPSVDGVLQQIDAKCEKAKRTYGKLFREGPDRALADVLVAVTGYKGFVPAKPESQTVVAKDCAFESRTVALTFGQTLQVVNKGDSAVIPELLGMKTHALVVAIPGGDPVTLLPARPGTFVLKDNSREYASAKVFVVRYPTTDVTGLDGRFEIPRVPVGKVRVSAYLPATGRTVQREIEARPGMNPEIAFEIPFEAAKDTPKGGQ